MYLRLKIYTLLTHDGTPQNEENGNVGKKLDNIGKRQHNANEKLKRKYTFM